MTGTVFSIEEFTVYDGPGIRTTVFLKGCPLRCCWCHNPEGQEPHPQVVRNPNGCIGCGRCEASAVTEDGGIRYTEESIRACPRGLLRVSGEVWEAPALCAHLLKNKALYADGGGVTFSGGEPLARAPFLLECLERLQGQVHTAVQTCGYAHHDTFRQVLERCDYMLYDLKLADPALHKQYTGVSNAPILHNLDTLARSGKPFVIRIPLIPGVTDTEENLAGLAALLQSYGIAYAELMPYNPLAGSKYPLVGRAYAPGFDETRPVETHPEVFAAHGITTVTL